MGPAGKQRRMAPDVRDRCTTTRFLSKGARTKEEEKGLMRTGSPVSFNPTARPVVNVATCRFLNQDQRLASHVYETM